MKKILYTWILISIISSTAYSSFPAEGNKPFRIKKAEYNSWVRDENIRGTDMVIILSHVKPDIVFKSITYRGIEVPVTVSTKGRRAIIKGTLNVGESIVEPVEYEVTGESDRITWESGGSSGYTEVSFRRREKETSG